MNSSSPTIDTTVAADKSAPNARRRGAVSGGVAADARGNSRWVRAAFALAIVPALWAAVQKPLAEARLKHHLANARRALCEFDPQSALDLLTPLVADQPDCAEAEFLLGAAYRHAGRLDLVEPHLRRAQELGWDVDEIDRQACLTFFQAGDFRRSGAELMQRMQEGASDDEAEEIYEAMARGYSSAMLLKQAVFILDAWVGWRPQSARARLLLADVAALRGDQQTELRCYRDAVRYNPSHLEARRRLARALMVSHEVEEAYELFATCLRDHPDDPEVLIGMAECAERHGKREEAKKYVARAFTLQPTAQQRSTALALQGQIALAEKEYASAAHFLQEAVDAHPANLPAVYSLSQALTHAGRPAEAKAYLERWRIAQEAEKKLDDVHAQILARPEDPDLRVEVGKALIDQGAANAGINWLLSVLFYHPSHPLANQLLAEQYDRNGQTALAARHRAIAEGEGDEVSSPSSSGAVLGAGVRVMEGTP